MAESDTAITTGASASEELPSMETALNDLEKALMSTTTMMPATDQLEGWIPKIPGLVLIVAFTILLVMSVVILITCFCVLVTGGVGTGEDEHHDYEAQSGVSSYHKRHKTKRSGKKATKPPTKRVQFREEDETQVTHQTRRVHRHRPEPKRRPEYQTKRERRPIKKPASIRKPKKRRRDYHQPRRVKKSEKNIGLVHEQSEDLPLTSHRSSKSKLEAGGSESASVRNTDPEFTSVTERRPSSNGNISEEAPDESGEDTVTEESSKTTDHKSTHWEDDRTDSSRGKYFNPFFDSDSDVVAMEEEGRERSKASGTEFEDGSTSTSDFESTYPLEENGESETEYSSYSYSGTSRSEDDTGTEDQDDE